MPLPESDTRAKLIDPALHRMVGIMHSLFALDPLAVRVVAYLDSVQARLASYKGIISLRELPSALDRAFKGEL